MLTVPRLVSRRVVVLRRVVRLVLQVVLVRLVVWTGGGGTLEGLVTSGVTEEGDALSVNVGIGS